MPREPWDFARVPMSDSPWVAVDERRDNIPLDTPLLVYSNGEYIVASFLVDDADDSPRMVWEAPCGCPLDCEPEWWMRIPEVPK